MVVHIWCTSDPGNRMTPVFPCLTGCYTTWSRFCVLVIQEIRSDRSTCVRCSEGCAGYVVIQEMEICELSAFVCCQMINLMQVALSTTVYFLHVTSHK